MNNVIQSMTPCSLLGLLLLRIQYLTTQDTCQLFPALGWVVTKFSPSVVCSFLNKTINAKMYLSNISVIYSQENTFPRDSYCM